ncbi:hypothetical protein [Mucilaginibacter myungsuensis]|uniref:Uncharacterized protein n=1 Tax=Mucilaginibacter myungsuensis TaxID=649104 RepID=A0A929L0K5_9SPHI|nr:hypothetical protein [Mucilaginibacter myungsuensis]MBE9661935.1 hypothetical protein [Mucilaginibacter myungsuensis]MDN3599632.1 hypothetical protein [Mucilaginibacter myungsuensis]
MQNDQNLEPADALTPATATAPIEAETFDTSAEDQQAINDHNDRLYAAFREQAQKDMIYGALWCVGGTVLTIADVGFIFWGAIVFGGIQFFKGLSNY